MRDSFAAVERAVVQVVMAVGFATKVSAMAFHGTESFFGK